MMSLISITTTLAEYPSTTERPKAIIATVETVACAFSVQNTALLIRRTSSIVVDLDLDFDF